MKLRKKNVKSEVAYVPTINDKSEVYVPLIKKVSSEYDPYAESPFNYCYDVESFVNKNREILPSNPHELYLFSCAIAKCEQSKLLVPGDLSPLSGICQNLLYGMIDMGHDLFYMMTDLAVNLEGRKRSKIIFNDLIGSEEWMDKNKVDIEYRCPVERSISQFTNCEVIFHEDIKYFPQGNVSTFYIKKMVEYNSKNCNGSVYNVYDESLFSCTSESFHHNKAYTSGRSGFFFNEISPCIINLLDNNDEVIKTYTGPKQHITDLTNQ
ncbi:MAG TPA: hypothetical protein VEC16_02285 [Alphaproteobacteria bacterium]|nr:hypothetical protein [Alphaproteobacteria bacterium]